MRSGLLGGLAVGVLSTVAPLAAAGAHEMPTASSALEAEMLAALGEANFGDIIDFGPFEDVCPGAEFCASPAPPMANLPNVDLAVIEFDAAGKVARVANVLLSRDHPEGVGVPIDLDGGDAGSYGTTSVRWRRWDSERYDGGSFDQETGERLTEKGWNDPPFTEADDVVAGREDAPLEFMVPYPASLFKLVVAFRVMRLVDEGVLSLDEEVSWNPSPAAGTPAGPEPGPDDGTVTKPLREWMFAMITYSDNDSARALIKLLWDLDDLPAMHAELRDLGLGTLQINGTRRTNGGNWQPGQFHMTALDTARLLWLIDGGDGGALWNKPDGSAVHASLLSPSSRGYLLWLLAEQGYHEALSTTNLCGADNVRPGIPARMPRRWIDPSDGTVTVDGYAYGHDVRPCNKAAEVLFSHKTGITFNAGSDAGIVRSIPGEPQRHYIIAMITNLGYRYADEVFAERDSYPCYDEVGLICYTQRFAEIGNRIDDFLRPAPEAEAPVEEFSDPAA